MAGQPDKRQPVKGGLADLLWSMIPPAARAQYAAYGEALPGLASYIVPGGDYWQNVGKDLSRGDYWQAAMSVPPALASTATDALSANTMKPARRAALDMLEAARMKRAAEQGYTVDAYKGAYPYDPETVPVRDWKGRVIEGAERVPQPLEEFNSPGRPYAGFFAESPDVASRFASAFREGAVYPVKLKFSNPLVLDGTGKNAAAFQFEAIAREQGAADAFNAFRDAFAKGDHDGVIIRNTTDEGTIYIPREPSQVRSRFAAFDPAQAKSGNIMAGLAGVFGLGAGAFAAPLMFGGEEPGF